MNETNPTTAEQVQALTKALRDAQLEAFEMEEKREALKIRIVAYKNALGGVVLGQRLAQEAAQEALDANME